MYLSWIHLHKRDGKTFDLVLKNKRAISLHDLF